METLPWIIHWVLSENRSFNDFKKIIWIKIKLSAFEIFFSTSSSLGIRPYENFALDSLSKN